MAHPTLGAPQNYRASTYMWACPALRPFFPKSSNFPRARHPAPLAGDHPSTPRRRRRHSSPTPAAPAPFDALLSSPAPSDRRSAEDLDAARAQPACHSTSTPRGAPRRRRPSPRLAALPLSLPSPPLPSPPLPCPPLPCPAPAPRTQGQGVEPRKEMMRAGRGGEGRARERKGRAGEGS